MFDGRNIQNSENNPLSTFDNLKILIILMKHVFVQLICLEQ